MHSSAKSMSGFFLFTIGLYCIENQHLKKKKSNHLTDLEKTNVRYVNMVKFRISLAFLASI